MDAGIYIISRLQQAFVPQSTDPSRHSGVPDTGCPLGLLHRGVLAALLRLGRIFSWGPAANLQLRLSQGGNKSLFICLGSHGAPTVQNTVVGKMTTFDLWPFDLGGGAWGAGTNMWHPETPASYESLPAPLATQIPTLYIHASGGRGRGGALILDRCRAFDLFASVDAHLCTTSQNGALHNNAILNDICGWTVLYLTILQHMQITFQIILFCSFYMFCLYKKTIFFSTSYKKTFLQQSHGQILLGDVVVTKIIFIHLSYFEENILNGIFFRGCTTVNFVLTSSVQR